MLRWVLAVAFALVGLVGVNGQAPTFFPTPRAPSPQTQQPTGITPNVDARGYTVFRVQQVLSANPFIFNPANTIPQRLTAQFVYANKAAFKDLIKNVDIAVWTKAQKWLAAQTTTLKSNFGTGLIWGTQAGWHRKLEMEISSVRDLQPGESAKLMGLKHDVEPKEDV